MDAQSSLASVGQGEAGAPRRKGCPSEKQARAVSKAISERDAQIMGRCGFCVGLKPGHQRVPKSETIAVCPCCGQYATRLFEGMCRSRHSNVNRETSTNEKR